MKTLIAIAVIIGVGAVAGSIVVGVRSFDGTVTEHPYEEGLRWDEIQKNKSDLGWQVNIDESSLAVGENKFMISVIDRHGKPLEGSDLAVTAGRPATAEHDQHAAAVEVDKGVFRTSVDFMLKGHWDIKIDVARGGDAASFNKRIYVKKRG